MITKNLVSNQPDGMFNDQNDFNRNVLENGMNGATSMPQQISVADETGQVITSVEFRESREVNKIHPKNLDYWQGKRLKRVKAIYSGGSNRREHKDRAMGVTQKSRYRKLSDTYFR